MQISVHRIAHSSGRSIPVVRMHGVHVDRVRFPAARQNENAPDLFRCFFISVAGVEDLAR